MTMSRFERWAIWSTTAAMLVTGVAYWWMKELLTPTEPWAVINHPLQPWLLKAHILVAPLLVFSVGLITSRHVWRHYRMGVGKGRRTGLLAALVFVVLTVSGYALQVVTAETLLRALMWGHLGLGVVYSLGVAAHWPATRRGRAAGVDRGLRPRLSSGSDAGLDPGQGRVDRHRQGGRRDRAG